MLGALLLLASAAAPAPVSETGPAVFHRAEVRRAAAVSDLVLAFPRLPGSARHALGALSPEERARLERKDSRGRLGRKMPALKVGISRAIPGGAGFEGLPAGGSGGLFERSSSGRMVWTASFSSEGAEALRLHLQVSSLPAGSRVYLYAASGEVHGPYAFEEGIRPEGFWTNTVFSDEVFLEVQFPAGADLSGAGFSVGSLVHLAGLRPKSNICFIDATCVTPGEFPEIADARLSVAQLTFVDAGDAYLCTGALMNAEPSTFVPYLLTANHCFANQSAAASLEALWRYQTASCDGPHPSPSLFPRTLGATLLATGPATDFTLVQLSEEPPDGSVYLGWTTADVAHAGGTALYRLSYAEGNPQIYTREEVSAVPEPVSCSGAPQGDYIYSKDVDGGTGGGSSGAPMYLEDLKVVGQLFGACGTNVEDDCDAVSNSALDGAFRVTFPSVQQWLAPSAGTCTPGATDLCLSGGRFRVSVAWATVSGSNGPGMAVPLTGDSGYFWFFNAANIEIVVKVLDACTIAPGRFWVFASGLTNVRVVMTVEDTETGARRVYTNPLGTAFQPIQDTSAFACP